MQSPILKAVRLGDDGRVLLQYVANGKTWMATFVGALGPNATVDVRSKWDDSYDLDADTELGSVIRAKAREWAMNNATVTFDGVSLESRALLADVMKELYGFWDATSARAHDNDVESTARMAAMFEETAIKQCMYAVVSVASSFHANPRKRIEEIAARAAAEAMGAASPDPIDLINEFIKR
ncbi:hypothetical protein [Corynebacterium aurimucosum]